MKLFELAGIENFSLEHAKDNRDKLLALAEKIQDSQEQERCLMLAVIFDTASNILIPEINNGTK